MSPTSVRKGRMPGAKDHKKALDHDRPFDWVQARTQQRPGKVREQEGDAKKFASFHSRSKTGHFTRDHFHRTGKLITNSTKISYALRQPAPAIRPVRLRPTHSQRVPQRWHGGEGTLASIHAHQFVVPFQLTAERFHNIMAVRFYAVRVCRIRNANSIESIFFGDAR